MQKKSLLSKAQEAAPAAMKPAPVEPGEMVLASPASGDVALAKLMGDRPLVAGVIESAGSGTPYMYSWWDTGSQQPIGGVKKGDMVLAAFGEQTKLELPIKGFLCTARQQWCERVPATGQVASASLEKQANGSKLEEEVEALLLIVSREGSLIPVTWRTRKGACRGLVTCMQELLAAATPEWLQQSEAHRLTARLCSPWMRFTVEIDHRLEQPSRPGRNPYPVTSAVCRPIDVDMFTTLKTFLFEEANQKLLAEVYATHQAKLQEVDDKLPA
jgi:hypothetical protein